MTLLAPPTAPVLAAALAAIADGDPDATEALVAAVGADELLVLPTTDDGRHPLATGATAADAFMTAFSGPGATRWAHPWGPPTEHRRVSEILGWVVSTGRSVRLDHASEADTVVGSRQAADLLAGRPVDVGAVAAGDAFRRPGPAAEAPSAPLAPPEPDRYDAGEVLYGRGWDPARRQVVEPLTVEELRTADLGAGYAAVRPGPGGLDAFAVGPDRVQAWQHTGTEVHHRDWARFAEGLFLTERSVADDHGGARPRPRVVELARPDGMVRQWAPGPSGEGEMTTSYRPDTRGRWIGDPPFGVHHPLLGTVP